MRDAGRQLCLTALRSTRLLILLDRKLAPRQRRRARDPQPLARRQMQRILVGLQRRRLEFGHL